MQQKLTRLRSQIERLQARMTEADTALPAWAARDGQGFLMIKIRLRELAARVTQASDPEWFEPSEYSEQAWREATKLYWAMIGSGGYGEASMLAQAELAKYPPYRYHRSEDLPKENP
jgi:hypothetical protein